MIQLHQNQQLGIRIQDIPKSDEYLTLNFSPTKAPRQDRWRHYGLSADFLGDYFSNFFPGDEDPDRPLSQRDTIKGSVSYIANELIENAVKYSCLAANFSIGITLYLYEQDIIFQVVNVTDQTTASRYRSFIENLLQSDLNDVYLHQLEQSAVGSEYSQMGLVTMMQDYATKFGWNFECLSDQSELTRVTVVACLSI